MTDYPPKSPEKSSPSFPEDAEDEYDNVMDFNQPMSPANRLDAKSDINMILSNVDSKNDHQDGGDMPMDDTLEDLESHKGLNNDTCKIYDSDKKVHWTNRHIQILLDCVESHLKDFSVSKKHKAVWQQIGKDMEYLGFNTEHCYNKWKNLRRDVRLLVNNPLKIVKNADVLRRVARLILIIYPNVDASTMQVTNERSGTKSQPLTPAGQTLLGPESPSLHRLINTSQSPMMTKIGGLATSFPTNTSVKSTVAPNTVLFTNIAPAVTTMSNLNNFNNVNLFNKTSENNLERVKLDTPSNAPIIFNPSALLVQSQMFNDLLKQNTPPSKASEDEASSPLLTGMSSIASDISQTSSTNINNLASNILNNLCSNGSANNLINSLVESLNGANASSSPLSSSSTSGIIERLQLSGELTTVVERLRDEETVHLRLTEMISHLADELRAAGQRRQATLDQLLGIVRSGASPNEVTLTNQSSNASNTVSNGNLRTVTATDGQSFI